MTEDWQAKWIWIEGEASPSNYWMVARKSFMISEQAVNASLRITADSRYVLWVNGERLGQGPIRSWHFAYHYDTYDLTGRLKPGKNVISVLVLHYGIGTFQYIPGRGGLLAQLDWTEEDRKAYTIGTDETWKVITHPSYSRRTPRIACQQAWVEHYDASVEPTGWERVAFDDLEWPQAVIVGPVGCEPWTVLKPRPIPFLTEEPIYPVNILRERLVESPADVWSFDLRNNLLPGYREANPQPICGLVVTTISVMQPTSFHLYSIGGWVGTAGKLRVNGKEVTEMIDRDGKEIEIRKGLGKNKHWAGQGVVVRLDAGENLLVWDVTGIYHEWSFNCIADSVFPVVPILLIEDGARFATARPFESIEDKDFQTVWNAKKISDLKDSNIPISPIKRENDYEANVFDMIAYAKTVDGTVPVEDRDALCSASEDVTIVNPAPDGSDIELLLDFGRMTVGFVEMELIAPEGVIIDGAGFESIQEGTLDLMWGMNNTFRYKTRAGLQKFHSVIRRGFRYLLLTVRGNTEPVRIRYVRTLLNTYPVKERGEFVSNDVKLNEIWKIGRYTTRLCSEDTFVDCPTYEQTFWVGDSRNEGAVNLMAYGEYDLSKHCLKLAGDSIKRSPLVESQVPSSWETILTAWSFLWALACEEYYQFTGDMKFVEEIYPVMAEQARNCEGMINEKDLFYINTWNMLDWAPMDTPNDGIITHNNAWLVETYRRTARLARLLGKNNEAEHYLEVAERLKGGINKHLWDEKRKAYADCIRGDGSLSPILSQQTNTIVYLCDCATPEREAIISEYIADVPEGFTKVGSPFMMFFTFEALVRRGAFQQILDLARKNWGFMLDNGATTCWETFPGFQSGQRWTRSHCHAWSSAPTYFLSAYQLGVRPLEPGFSKALIAPVPADLKWVRGKVPTPHGEIFVAWEKGEGTFDLSVYLPGGVNGSIKLPVGPKEYPNLKIVGKGIWQSKDEGEIWAIDVSAGGCLEVKASH